MASEWRTIRIELLGGGGIECDPPPGRDILVGPRHTFGDLAEAINTAFARWDRSHLYEFTLPDGRKVGIADEDAPPEQLDRLHTRVLSTIGAGDEFEYVFDLGDSWEHQCRVDPEPVDPMEMFGERPGAPVPLFGWGSIPDQYGRLTAED